VLIRWDEIARYRSPGNYGFTDYVTPELVHQELVREQQILRPVPVIIGGQQYVPESGEVFEVNYE
jgi:hypothetical protein